MTYKHSLSHHSLILMTAFIICGKSVKCDTPRFLIFSELDDSIYQLYLRMQSDIQQQLDSGQPLNVACKRQICEDISNDFGCDRLKIREPKKPVDRISSLEEFTVHTTLDAYLRKTFKERGFVCKLSSKYAHYALKLFISTEYNLNTISRLPADHIPGRFVYSKKNGKNPILFGLAEVPATGLSSPAIDVESYYLEKKNKYTAMLSEPTKDPLCGLKLEDKLRICHVVFLSPYFKGKLEYQPSVVKSIDQNCVRKTITPRGRVEKEKNPRENKFDELLLSCARTKKTSKSFDPPFDYFISHAYEPNAILVYFIDKEKDEIFLENLSTKVRINVDVSKFPKVSEIKNDKIVSESLSKSVPLS